MKHFRKITDLDPQGCKWPCAQDAKGIHLFCNEQQRENSSYCQEHHAKAYAGRPGPKPVQRRGMIHEFH